MARVAEKSGIGQRPRSFMSRMSPSCRSAACPVHVLQEQTGGEQSTPPGPGVPVQAILYSGRGEGNICAHVQEEEVEGAEKVSLRWKGEAAEFR